jgi:hypothetical protein
MELLALPTLINDYISLQAFPGWHWYLGSRIGDDCFTWSVGREDGQGDSIHTILCLFLHGLCLGLTS